MTDDFKDYEPAVIFLISVLIILCCLPVLYRIAEKLNEHLDVVERPKQLQVESSDEESLNDYTPSHGLKEEDDKTITKADKDDVSSLCSNYLVYIEKTKNQSHGIHMQNNNNVRYNLLNVYPQTLTESCRKAKLEIKLKRIEGEKEEFVVLISNVANILMYQHGGPQKVKFVLKLFQDGASTNKYSKKMSSQYFDISNDLNITDQLPPPFRWENIPWETLGKCKLRIKLLGCRQKFLSKTVQNLGCVHLCLRDIFAEAEHDVIITRFVLPPGDKKRGMENVLSGDIFPLNEDKWKEMLDKIKDSHPDGENIINKVVSCHAENEENSIQPMIKEPVFSSTQSVVEKIKAIQKYLNQLQYNHTGTQFFDVKMNRSIIRLYETAKDIIKFSLPIKCLEATIVSLYLTAKINGLTRFTIRFKSKLSGSTTHRHIVLGIYYNSTYGALGLSRRKTLMYKPLKYKSLNELIEDFQSSYSNCFHELKKIKISHPISNDIHSCDQICWNYFVLPISKMDKDKMKSALEKISRELRLKCL